MENNEKCTYCREYGNLPCDECNKKLEAKKAMSKRLEELYEKMVDEAPFVFPESNRKYVYELAEIYAREVAQASLEKASELPQNLYDDEWHLEKLKESVTNPDNIVII